MANIRPKTGFCINCDNRHGCKSKTPPCLVAMEENGAGDRSGRQYLIEQSRTGECRGCPFLRSCWSEEEYEKISRSVS